MEVKRKVVFGAATALLSVGLLAGCGSASSTSNSSGGSNSSTSNSSGGSSGSGSGGTVTIVSLRATSGPAASLGVPGNNALQMAVDALNAKGGLLGKKVVLKVLNTESTPSLASTLTRQAIQQDHAVALFGGVSSGDGAYEVPDAKKFHKILFSYTFNDAVFTRTSQYTPYFFSLVPNTDMEPMAAALAFKQNGWTKIYTISPNYNYGRAEVAGFLAALKKLGVHYTLVGQQWPALGASSFTSNISAILAAHPQAVFGGIYGSDLLTFTKEAEGYNLFKKTHMVAQWGSVDLQALGSQAPYGAIGFSRGGWWTLTSQHPQVTTWANQYHTKYGSWPSAYSMLGTKAFDAWVYGVKKANSFNSTKVSQALAGATIPTIFGSYKIRAADHQAEIPEYIGVISNKGQSKFGFAQYNPTIDASWNNIKEAPPTKAQLQSSGN